MDNVNEQGAKRIAVVFDYDFTLIECNSDTYVFEKLWPSRANVVLEVYENECKQWTLSMDKSFELYYKHHPEASREQILSTVAQVPVQDMMIDTLRACHEFADLYIVSDANTKFIEAFLDDRGIRDLFKSIVSNVATNSGRFGVAPYYDFLSQRPHGCPQCPPNMCKGKIIDEELALLDSCMKIIYLGDGSGDYCPSSRLREGDVVLARKDFPLAKDIQSAPISAQVYEWENWTDIFEILQTHELG